MQGRRIRGARDEVALLRWLGRSANSAVALVRGSRLTLTNGSFSDSTGTITVNTPGGSQSITISLAVYPGAVLLPTPGSLIFEYQVGGAVPFLVSATSLARR